MSKWRKYILASAAILLANELIIGLVIGRMQNEPNPSLIPEQDKMAGKEQVLSPKAKDEEHARPPNVEKREFSQNEQNRNIEVDISEEDEIDGLSNAVISYSEESKVHHISYGGVFGSWLVRTKDRYDAESFHMASRKNPWLRTSFAPNGKECDTRNNNVTYPLMFVPALFEPANCIQDLLFSLLPMASQGRLRDFRAVAVKRPDEYSDDDGTVFVRDYKGDYCTLVLRELGWFQDIVILPNNTCLEDIWVPAFIYHRFPRGWSKGAQSSSSDYIRSEDLPLEKIFFLQQQMWKTFIARNKFLYKGKKGRIIFDSRQGTGRGEWTNAGAIAKLVQEQLDPDLFEVEVVDDVGALTVEEQAALFHSASIMVAPSGSGSIANAIFMRPHAIVYELSCGEPSWVRDW
eukprot:CAMPEP_0183710792 /NCGR_PEP_ID=MMETSP0737-20130205/6438_1 /TAXON_ID=385413 /ORGANISM="Thalassiosira miniscula, Strain CCMP1093" /LENGTH=403 /DNA_ID=CAMNT_0025939133 /DNA_START=92 /DNA_END=1300 /DNA_ORIENTATION=+